MGLLQGALICMFPPKQRLCTAGLESSKMVARIEQNDEKISKLSDDKDSKNTHKKSFEGKSLDFKAYLPNSSNSGEIDQFCENSTTK